jgi:hypothetical protein
MTGSIFYGKYVLIADSADASVSMQKLALAHNYVKELTRKLLAAGGGVVIFAGGEPLHEKSGLPLIFDWTVLKGVEAFSMVRRRGA